MSMYVYVCIKVCLCMYKSMSMYVYVCLCMYVYICIYIYIYLDMHMYMYMCIYVYVLVFVCNPGWYGMGSNFHGTTIWVCWTKNGHLSEKFFTLAVGESDLDDSIVAVGVSRMPCVLALFSCRTRCRCRWFGDTKLEKTSKIWIQVDICLSFTIISHILLSYRVLRITMNYSVDFPTIYK